MKISLFQVILLGVFGVGALVGLFVFATYSGSNGGGGSIGTVTIWGTLSEDDFQAALTTIAQTNQSLKNISYVQKDPLTLKSELSTAIATDTSPDLVLTSQEDLYSLYKFLIPIPSDTLPKSTFTNTFVEEGDLFAAPDGYYGVPFLIDPLVLFSNRTIFSSIGIAKPPATWESLTGLVPNIAVMTPTKQITRGLIALGTYKNVRNARGILSALLVQEGIPISSYSETGGLSANFNGSNSEDSTPGEAVVNFYTQFADSSKVSYSWNDSLMDSRQMFLAGDLALYIGYASEAKFLKEANPNLNFATSILPQPATAVSKSTYALLYAFMIPRGAKNPSGAYQAAVLLTNSNEQAIMASETGLAPATLVQLSTQPQDPTASVAYAEALYSKGWISPSPSDTDKIFSAIVDSVVTGRSTASTALSLAESSLSLLLRQ